MKHRSIAFASALVALSLSTPVLAADDEHIGDGDPGVVDLPKDLSDHPVQLALEQLPMCGSDQSEETVDVPGLFGEIPVASVVLAIEDGEIVYPMLTNAVNRKSNPARSNLQYAFLPRPYLVPPGPREWCSQCRGGHHETASRAHSGDASAAACTMATASGFGAR